MEQPPTIEQKSATLLLLYLSPFIFVCSISIPELSQFSTSSSFHFPTNEQLIENTIVGNGIPIYLSCSIFDVSFKLSIPKSLVDYDFSYQNEHYEIFLAELENRVANDDALLLKSSNRATNAEQPRVDSLRTITGKSVDGTIVMDMVFSSNGLRLLNAVVDKTFNYGFHEKFFIQSLPGFNVIEEYIMYPMKRSPLPQPHGRQLQSTTKLLVDLQLDMEYITRNGGSCSAAAEVAQQVFAQVSIQYQSDLGFPLQITSIFCDEDGTSYPSNYLVAESLLGLISSNWNAVLNDSTQKSRAIADLTHLLTGKDLLHGGTSGVVGLAYSNTACGKNLYSCSLSMSDFHAVIEERVGAATSSASNIVYAANNSAHEIGHMLGAVHCTDNCQSTMNPAILGVSHFGANAIAAIESFRNQVKTCYCDVNVC